MCCTIDIICYLSIFLQLDKTSQEKCILHTLFLCMCLLTGSKEYLIPLSHCLMGFAIPPDLFLNIPTLKHWTGRGEGIVDSVPSKSGHLLKCLSSFVLDKIVVLMAFWHLSKMNNMLCWLSLWHWDKCAVKNRLKCIVYFFFFLVCKKSLHSKMLSQKVSICNKSLLSHRILPKIHPELLPSENSQALWWSKQIKNQRKWVLRICDSSHNCKL